MKQDRIELDQTRQIKWRMDLLKEFKERGKRLKSTFMMGRAAQSE